VTYVVQKRLGVSKWHTVQPGFYKGRGFE